MKRLIEKEENEVDDFWMENKYFGKFDDMNQEDNEDDDYQQSSSGKDEFDTDFQDTSELGSENGDSDMEFSDYAPEKKKAPQKKPPSRKPGSLARAKKVRFQSFGPPEEVYLEEDDYGEQA